MASLAFVMKWEPSIHGYNSDEIDYLKYLQTKEFVIERVWCNDHVVDDNMSLIDNINWLNKWRDKCMPTTPELRLCPIKNMYRYKDRDFAVMNHGLETFQKHWKKYWKGKMQFFKSVKNLKYRETHGNYPLFNKKSVS